MPRKSKRMESIRDLAQHDEQAAIEKYGESSRAVEANIRQLEDLESYRAEYREMLIKQGEVGFSAAKMQQYHHFLLKLDEVIEHQQQQIVLSKKVCEQRRDEWLQSRTRTNALDKVTQRYQESEAEDERRREQKDSDEIAQQRR